MECSCVRHTDIPGASKLFSDFIYHFDRVAGFYPNRPNDAVSLTGAAKFDFPDDLSFSRYLVEKIGVAVVPGSSFYDDQSMGARQVRFTFCKKESTLAACAEKLSKLRSK